MSLTYTNIPSNTRSECYQIAIDDGRKIYYCDDEIDILDTNPNAVEIISDLIDSAINEFNLLNVDIGKAIEVQTDIINKDIPPNRHSKKIYNDVRNVISTLESKFYLSPTSDIQVLPRMIENQRDCIYVSGKSGAGKSTWAGNYAQQYQNEVSKRVFLLSVKEYDSAIDTKVQDLIRIKLNKDFVIAHSSKDDILNTYANSLVIFDDFQQISDRTILGKLDEIKGLLMEVGRAHNIYVISIQHKLLGGKQSIKEFTESDMIVFFPRYDNGEITNALKKLHFGKMQISNILNSDGKKQRWLCLIRPNIIITPAYIKIIDL